MWKWTNVFAAGRPEHAPAPALPFDLLAAEFVADPAPGYAWLRDNAPLAALKGGGYVLTRAADIHDAFTDPRLGNAPSRFSMLAAKNRDRYTAAGVAANIPPFLDKPRHVDMRRPLSAAFYDAFAGAHGWIDDLAQEHVARARAQGRAEVISQIGRPYAAQAMARFVGLDHDPAAIATATGAVFKLFAPITDRAGFEAVNTGLDATRRHIAKAVERRHADPGNDLISHLIAYQKDHDGTPNDVEIGDNALLVLADGIENIEAAIAQVLILLDRNPHARAALGAGALDPGAVVREALRLETPAQLIARVVREPHVRHGVPLSEGTPVFLALGSANRDPGLHPDPDRFDPARDPAQALTFGRGRHRCIGADLGQMLITAAVRALAAHPLRLVDPPEALRYQPRVGHRWAASLRIAFDPAP
jgi:cytochrome P450